MAATLTTWTALRDQTIDRFNGQTPRPEDEGPIIDAYEAHPSMVIRAIDQVADALNANTITHGWSILRSRVERGQQPVREATPQTGAEKTKRIVNAERYIHNAGLHLDQWDVEDELFGERGLLKDYAGDTTVRARMLEHWQNARPRGITAAAEHEVWNRACATTATRTSRPATTTNDAINASTNHQDADADELPF